MTRKYVTVCVVSVLSLGAAVQAWSLPWDKDMRNQPSVKPQEAQVEHNASSVPVAGTEKIATPKDIGELVLGRLKAGADLTNPVRKSPESLIRGQEVYDIHCNLCHGEQGRGDGLVGRKFVPAPMDLTLDYVQMQADGQLFFTITHGSIAMPYYRDSIVESDRWHVVNYIKDVLGKK